jgi:competence protein ComEC
LLGCFCFLIGVAAHSFFDIKVGSFWLYNFALAAGIGMIIFWNDKKTRLIFLGAFFIVAGLLRFDISVRENNIFPKYFNETVNIVGILDDEPARKIDKQQLTIRPTEINGSQFLGAEKILAAATLYPEYAYGEQLKISCKLTEPKTFTDFDYAKWLTINDIYGLCYWPEISAYSVIPTIRQPAEGISSEGYQISSSVGMTIKKDLLSFKNFLINKVNLALHEPYASFLSGLILGAKSSMPPQVLENFRRSGLTHIIAISGWNIAFLSWLAMPLLFFFRIRRGRAFYLMLVIIFAYALLAGASASVIRAAIMGATLLLAQKIHRPNVAGRALLYAVAIMFIQNPRAIYDVGFWLSSAATFGLIYFSPILESAFAKKKISFANEYLGATITATIFTVPVSLYIFGGVSVWSLPANLLILPFVPIAFVLSLIGMGAAAILPATIAAWFLYPASGVLSYLMKVAEIFGNLPGFLEWRMSLIVVVAYYAALCIFTFGRLKELNEKI